MVKWEGEIECPNCGEKNELRGYFTTCKKCGCFFDEDHLIPLNPEELRMREKTSLEDNIVKYIDQAEEHPTMRELLEEYQVYDGGVAGQVTFYQSLISLVSCNEIIYDHKHDSWFLPTPMNDGFIMVSIKELRSSNDDKTEGR